MQNFFPLDYFENLEADLKPNSIDTTMAYLQKYQNYCQKSLMNERIPRTIKNFFFSQNQQFSEIDSKIINLHKQDKNIVLKTQLAFSKETTENIKKYNLIFNGVTKYLIRKIYPQQAIVSQKDLPALSSMIPCQFSWTFEELSLTLYMMHFDKDISHYYSILFDFERMSISKK